MFRTVTPVIWTFSADLGTTLERLQAAADKAGFQAGWINQGSLVLDVPRAVFKRRPAATLRGTVRAVDGVTDIDWGAYESNSKDREHLCAIEEQFGGDLHDHGVRRAAAAAGLAPLSAAELRAVTDLFHGYETALAIGTGNIGPTAGIVALTEHRLVFAGEPLAQTGFLSFAIGSIQALTLGKRTTGETLTLVSDRAKTIVITHLGHGEGHGIASAFRSARDSRSGERTSHANSPGQRPSPEVESPAPGRHEPAGPLRTTPLRPSPTSREPAPDTAN